MKTSDSLSVNVKLKEFIIPVMWWGVILVVIAWWQWDSWISNLCIALLILSFIGIVMDGAQTIAGCRRYNALVAEGADFDRYVPLPVHVAGFAGCSSDASIAVIRAGHQLCFFEVERELSQRRLCGFDVAKHLKRELGRVPCSLVQHLSALPWDPEGRREDKLADYIATTAVSALLGRSMKTTYIDALVILLADTGSKEPATLVFGFPEEDSGFDWMGLLGLAMPTSTGRMINAAGVVSDLTNIAAPDSRALESAQAAVQALVNLISEAIETGRSPQSRFEHPLGRMVSPD